MESGEHGEHIPAPKPEFDGGAFSISVFSPTEVGFSFVARNSIRRRPDRSERISPLTDQQKKRLKNSYKGERGELSFNKANEVTDARDALKETINGKVDSGELVLPEEIEGKTSQEMYLQMQKEPDIEEARKSGNLRRFIIEAKNNPDFIESLSPDLGDQYQKFEEIRKTYRQKGKKVGIRNISVDGNTITADIKLVSFPVYNEFSGPTDPEAILDLSSLAGTAMIIRTKDNRLLIQHRAVTKQRLTEDKLSRGNATYPDVPGTSSGGLVDASMNSQDRKAGTPDREDTQFLDAILKETEEEVGLAPGDLDKVRMIALAQDKIKIHDVPLFFADSKWNADKIHTLAEESSRSKKLGPADFEEKFIDIEAFPDAIKKLLTEVQCPLPGDHAAAFVAAGYVMVLEKEGKPAADRWKTELEEDVKQNYAAINERVRNFYNKYPEALTQVPERFWGKKAPIRRLNSYDPQYTPEEQGLPNFEDAMVEAGLIPEIRRPIPEVLMFDVDGPLSDPVEKRIIYDELVTSLSDRLAANEPVFLNTGRSTEWIMERVTPRIREQLQDISSLRNLVIIGEKGGTWVTFNEQGEAHHGKSAAISIPEAVNEAAKKLVTEKYSDCMFFDATKQTMMSIEMHEGYDLQMFKDRQRELVEDLNALLAETGIDNTYKVDATTIATDVESPYAGKALGADRSLQWLRDSNIKTGQFVAFGDSISDLEMADELQRKGLPVQFVYVGDPEKLEEAKAARKIKDENIIINVGGFSQGTLDYLQRSNF
jgi:hypothetical protein